MVNFRINDTRQTGAVRNRTYRLAKVLIIFNIHHNWTLQIGAVGNSAYQTRGAKVSIYF